MKLLESMSSYASLARLCDEMAEFGLVPKQLVKCRSHGITTVVSVVAAMLCNIASRKCLNC